MDQIAIADYAVYQGIPATTVAFSTTPGNQDPAAATGATLTIFGKIDKSSENDTAESRNNDNEIMSVRRTNKTYRLTFSAKLTGATKAAALGIAQDLPRRMDAVAITCADDSQGAGTAYVDSCTASYTRTGIWLQTSCA